MLKYIPGSAGSAAGDSSPRRAAILTVNCFDLVLPFGAPSGNLLPAEEPER